MRRLILIPFLTFLVLGAIGFGVFWYFYQNYLYYRTDDAQVYSQIVPITALANGKLTSLAVKQGDRVTAGQTIATIQPATAAPAAGGASSQPQTIDITSPIDGVILSTPAVQQQSVAAGLTLASVTSTNPLSIVANIDEGAINNIKTGQDVDIHIDAYGDTSFTGKVQQIVNATAGSFSLIPQDTSSSNFTKVGQRIPVIISLDGNGGKNIVTGMSAEVTIHIH